MYRFETGSYKTPLGYYAAIACYKDKSKEVEFILVKSNHTFKTEDLATEKSEEALIKAFEVKIETGDDMSVGKSLSLDGFKIINDPLVAE